MTGRIFRWFALLLLGLTVVSCGGGGGGGFGGTDTLKVSITADKTTLQSNFANAGPNPSGPYTNTITGADVSNAQSDVLSNVPTAKVTYLKPGLQVSKTMTTDTTRYVTTGRTLVRVQVLFAGLGARVQLGSATDPIQSPGILLADGAIANLTSRSLLLDRGKVIRFDRTEDVIVQYAKREQVESTFTRDVVTTRQPKIKSVRIHTSLPGNIHKFGQALTIEVELYTPVKPANVTWMSIFVRDQQNKPITQVWTSSQDTPSLCADTGTSRVICTLPESKLYMGHYDLSVYLSGPPDTEQYDSVEHVCPFEVVMYGKERAWKWDPGMATYLEESRWEVADSSASSEGV
jgi:hypothetical protein